LVFIIYALSRPEIAVFSLNFWVRGSKVRPGEAEPTGKVRGEIRPSIDNLCAGRENSSDDDAPLDRLLGRSAGFLPERKRLLVTTCQNTRRRPR
jgi:hypothetical protein